MPDTSGWPTEAEVIKRLEVISPDVLPADILGQVGFLLQNVIAEFQSPQTRNGGGGTGRNFTPFTETRLYDGHGSPHLYLGDDLVPGQTPTVILWGSSTPLTNVLLVESKRGIGYNTLAIQNATGSFIPGFWQNGFPIGLQNVSVTGLWGYAATVPFDVNQAILAMTCYRVITNFLVDFAGVGVEVRIGNNSVNTAAGISAFRVSSPIGVLLDQYLDTVARYRTSSAYKLKSFAQRMS